MIGVHLKATLLNGFKFSYFRNAEANTTPAAGIERGCPQGCRRQAARGEEATLGATPARCRPVRQPRTTGESPAAAHKKRVRTPKCPDP